ncbi:hypothetical protein SAMN04488543_1281 [Friedmanniella luteola]|uniref:PknH-like extracellular domain-containing protein n=1 Tax=Friedmanniella luteola TaxID=546871 RepID=A0A1H1QC38_9ACTN|nr:hypothetical protein [Friedmanniella luteola]SDS20837.1 hypothetical protein SAMN04488543_1281 [Friedmanniella luteola]
MTGHDLDQLLRGLSADAEHGATPLDPVRVRRLGARRRHRRHAATAAAAAVVVALAGGGLLTQLPGRDDTAPPPVASAVPSRPAASPAPDAPSTVPPTPARTVGTATLLRAADVPTRGGPALEIAPTGTGRVPDELSACIPDGLAPLRASGQAARDFRHPGQEQPAVQTLALQFADPGAAQRAERVVRGWVDDCAATLEDHGNTLLDAPGDPVRVEVTTPAGTSGEFAVVPVYTQQGGESSQEGFFESLGVTRVDDRLMLTVEVVVGMDDNVSLQPGGDPAGGQPEHPQFGLVRAAAERLAG